MRDEGGHVHWILWPMGRSIPRRYAGRWVGRWNRSVAKQASQPGPHPGNTASRDQAFLELALLFSLNWVFPKDHPWSSWHVTLSHFWVLALEAPFCLEGCIHSHLPFSMVLLCLGGFPGGASGKEPTANAGDIRDVGLIHGSGRSPGGEYGNPLQYSCLENPMDRGARWAAVHRVINSWIQLKRLSTYTYLKTQLRRHLPHTAIHNPMTPSIYACTVEHTKKCSLTCLCSLLDCKSLKGLVCSSLGTVFLMPKVAPGTWQAGVD